MHDIFVAPFNSGLAVNPWNVLIRLLAALLMGGLVAWIYLRTTKDGEIGTSFPITLTLLAILIAMVTQVIGDNVARAFSLVGALSIVRFRTVVRDTKDTAYVIFAVVVGMAVGAQNFWVASIGLVIIGAAAFTMAARSKAPDDSVPPFLLKVRVGLGNDFDGPAGPILDSHLYGRTLVSAATVRQGASLEFIYETRLRPGSSADNLIKALNRIEGVQDVRMQLRGFEKD
jgi:hypothetical protein